MKKVSATKLMRLLSVIHEDKDPHGQVLMVGEDGDIMFDIYGESVMGKHGYEAFAPLKHFVMYFGRDVDKAHVDCLMLNLDPLLAWYEYMTSIEIIK